MQLKVLHIRILIFFGGLLIFVPFWGQVHLFDWDEINFAESAREMLLSSDFLNVQIDYNVFWEKPPLFIWMQALSMKIFGVNEFAARLPNAICGAFTLLVLFNFGRHVYGQKFGLLWVLVYVGSILPLVYFKSGIIDPWFNLFIFLGVYYFIIYQDTLIYRSKSDRIDIALSALFLGLAVLTKGLLGFLFPGAAALIYMVYKKDFLLFRQKATLLGFLLFLLISLPWHIVMYNMHGQFFIDEYFGNVHLRRVLGAEHRRLDNWYFYFALMFAGVLPWSLFWFPTIKKVFSEIKNKTKESDWLIFLIGWITSVLIFTQPAASKLASYIFPLFPSVAILLAFYLDSAIARAADAKKSLGLMICGYAMVAVLIGVIIGGNIAGRMYLNVIGSLHPILIASFFVALIACLITFFNLRRQYLLMLFSYVGISATLLVMLFFAKPYIEPWVSCKDVSQALNKIDTTNSRVLASKFYVRGVRFYTDRKMAVIDIAGKGFWSPHPIPFLSTDQMVIDYLNEEKVNYAVVKEGNVQDLYRILKDRSYKIENLFGIGGKYILRITKL
ncbi:MAG: hypothetical protein A2447_02520 [Omnitrophica WOR_2 bacterium RIFOXYC2_FULL_38_12]|nr:MAG: hypothetical protein A2447_02520 [Omnitrophica WOR_2 bacterium RIFOXYC2_FULL_38_12]